MFGCAKKKKKRKGNLTLYVLGLRTLYLKVFETCICAVPMLGKQPSAVHLITEGMHRTAIIYNGLPGNAYHILM